MARSGDEQPCPTCGGMMIWAVPSGMADGRNPRLARRGDALGWWEDAGPVPFVRHRCDPVAANIGRLGEQLSALVEQLFACNERITAGEQPQPLPTAAHAGARPDRAPGRAVAHLGAAPAQGPGPVAGHPPKNGTGPKPTTRWAIE